jgi:hypothetical protein
MVAPQHYRELSDDKGDERYCHEPCCVAGLHISRDASACDKLSVSIKSQKNTFIKDCQLFLVVITCVKL